MKVYYYNKYDREEVTFYTQELIKHIAKKNGHEIVEDPADCDFATISLAHHSEIKDIKRLRKMTDRPIVAGGHATYAPLAIAEFADLVNLGHGFQFFKDLDGSLDALADKPYIYHKDKTGQFEFNQFIDWEMIPLIQTGKNTFGIFWSTGCRFKCNFCATSWINSYQRNPNSMHLKMAYEKTRGKMLNVVTNDYSKSNIGRKVSDVMLKEYNKAPLDYAKLNLIRAGVESVTEEGRYFFGKHIKDKEITEFVQKTLEHHKECNIFFIAGIDTTDQWIEFAEKIVKPDSINRKPRLNLIINYFNPNIYTPLERFDLTKIKVVDFQKVLFHWRRVNSRLRIYKSNNLKPYSKIEQTLKERASSAAELEAIFVLEKEVFPHLDGGFQTYIDRCDELGLGDLLRGKFNRLDITFPHDDKKQKKQTVLKQRSLI